MTAPSLQRPRPPQRGQRRPRSRRATAVAALAALALATAGCGDDDEEPLERPSDFRIAFSHADGTVPPPYHREWELTAQAGSGEVAFTPDYSGDGVPTYRESFDPDPAALDRLLANLRDAGLLGEEITEPRDVPVGGSVDRATIIADGETTEVPAFSEDGSAPLAPFVDEVKGLAPADLWARLEQRANAYAERRYGETP